MPRRVFCCATAPAAACGGFSFLQKKQENTGEDSHALSTRPKRKSLRTPARGAQSGNHAGAGIVVRTRRGHRRQADRARGGRRHAGHSRVHGAAYNKPPRARRSTRAIQFTCAPENCTTLAHVSVSAAIVRL